MFSNHSRILPGDSLKGALDSIQRVGRRASPLKTRNALLSVTTRGTFVRPVASAGQQIDETSTTLIPRYG